jgi:hypothetical protein
MDNLIALVAVGIGLAGTIAVYECESEVSSVGVGL